MKPSPVVIPALKDKQVTVAKDQQDTYRAYEALVGILPQKPLLSRWQFTDEERAAIAAGADLFFTQFSFGDQIQPIRFEIAHELSEEQVREDLNLREYEIRFIRFEDHSEDKTVEEAEARKRESDSYFPTVQINGLMFTWEQLIDAPELAEARRYIERANGAPLLREPPQPKSPTEAQPTQLEPATNVPDDTKPTIN